MASKFISDSHYCPSLIKPPPFFLPPLQLLLDFARVGQTLLSDALDVDSDLLLILKLISLLRVRKAPMMRNETRLQGS